MSLVAWFPLNGNLADKGLSNYNLTVTGTTSYVDGKIGKCLSCNGSSYWSISKITLGKTYSIAWWSKTATTSKMPWCSNATVSLKQFNFYLTQNIYCLNTDDSAQNPFRDSSGTNVPALLDNKWHHFVVVFKGDEKAKLYIDGIYKGQAITYRNPTVNNTWFRIGGGYNDTHNYDFNGGLNDFRIYNHALSEGEVKELAKGLIAHYRLTGNVNPNLCSTILTTGYKVSLTGQTYSYNANENYLLAKCTDATTSSGGFFIIYFQKQLINQIKLILGLVG